jgi:hypothetical protein
LKNTCKSACNEPFVRALIAGLGMVGGDATCCSRAFKGAIGERCCRAQPGWHAEFCVIDDPEL